MVSFRSQLAASNDPHGGSGASSANGKPTANPTPPVPAQPTKPASTGPGGRLNLLLSTAPWQSDAWALNLPRLLEPMGVFAHHVGTARDAERVIRALPIHIAVIDLEIPLDSPRAGEPIESGGSRVLDLLSRLDAPPPTVVLKAQRSHRDDCREMQSALRCGAFAVVDRAAADLEMMLLVMQRCLKRFYAGRWPEPGGPTIRTEPPTTWV